MVKLERGDPPDFWSAKQVKWTIRWQTNHQAGKSWQWPQHDGRKLNQHVDDAMRPWHHDKCAFCEAAPEALEVEHFASKALHPDLAFTWSNFFLACAPCNQAKRDAEHQGCLKPDEDDPANFLRVDPISLKVKPRPGLSPSDKERAEKTIQLYRLNRPELERQYLFHWWRMTTTQRPPTREMLLRKPSDLTWIARYIKAMPEKVRREAEPDHPYSLMVKSMLERYAPQNDDAGD